MGPAKSCSNIMVVENASGQQQQAPTHSYNYVVTAHKPTAVTQVAVGSFTSPTGTDLLVAKSSRLEIHSITPDGLEAVLDVPIYGRISALKLFKPASRSKSLLFLLTERYKFCVLEYSEEGKLVTVANGDVEDAIGRPCECGHICVVDEEATMIGLHMYDGHLKIIPIDEQGRLSEQAFNVRLEELKVVDLAFVDRQVLAVLYEDTKGARGVRSYQLGAGGVLEDGPLRRCVLLLFTRTFARSSRTPVDARPSDSHLRHTLRTSLARVTGVDGGMLVGVKGGVALVVGRQVGCCSCRRRCRRRRLRRRRCCRRNCCCFWLDQRGGVIRELRVG